MLVGLCRAVSKLAGMEPMCGSFQCSWWLCWMVCDRCPCCFCRGNEQEEQVDADMLMFTLGFRQLLVLGQFCGACSWPLLCCLC
jgi:hypothetical protein